MSKQLRLDVAQLTDVGRKRPHNEDNMAYVIPKDSQVMARKGALFIVADGMGGHAAGEVASEIAVDTISTVYYQDDSDDIVISLVRSIKRANTLIHQRAAENMSRSGMGTTCVAAVMRGDMACVANVGDSRAYLIRKGLGRQVSQDHSWVEEQVRAGLLTQDQARSHAQKNVITRSLGTQPDVEVDIFTEKMDEGDTLVLCSDGLSNMVPDEELHTIVNQYVPQESVYRLVERANENGGSDNITAIVINMIEAGTESPPIRYPVHVGGREASDEATAILGRIPSAPLGIPARANSGQLPGGGLMASPPSFQSASPRSSSSGGAVAGAVAPRRKRNRLFFPVLVTLVVLLLGALGTGGYYTWRLLSMPVDVNGLLDKANVQISRAKGELASDPSGALKDLADAQTNLRGVQTGGALTDVQQQRFNDLMHNQFTPAVQSAITNYNQQAKIFTLPCPTTDNVPVNTGSTNTQPGNIAAIQGDKEKLFSYTLGDDHNLYQIDGQHSLVNPYSAPGGARFSAIASTKQHLLALTIMPGKSNNDPPTYSVLVLTPGPDGKIGKVATNSLDAFTSVKNGGWEPKLIAAWDEGQEKSVYVVLTSPNTQNQALIVDFSLGNDNKLNNARPQNISVSTNPASIAAFPKKQLFLLDSAGNVQSLQLDSKQAASSVVVQHPIATPLDTSAQDYNFKTNVPRPATGQASTFLALPLPSTPRATYMLSGMVNNAPHLFVVDGMYHRILDLQVATVTNQSTPVATATAPANGNSGGNVVASPPVTLDLNQQYASPSLLDIVKGVTVDPKAASTLYLLSSRDSAPASLLTVDTGPKNNCDTPR